MSRTPPPARRPRPGRAGARALRQDRGPLMRAMVALLVALVAGLIVALLPASVRGY